MEQPDKTIPIEKLHNYNMQEYDYSENSIEYRTLMGLGYEGSPLSRPTSDDEEKALIEKLLDNGLQSSAICLLGLIMERNFLKDYFERSMRIDKKLFLKVLNALKDDLDVKTH